MYRSRSIYVSLSLSPGRKKTLSLSPGVYVYACYIWCSHACSHLFLLVLQADAAEHQPQRLTSREWAAQDHALFHSSRGVRQPHDPLTALVVRGSDQVGGTLAMVPWLIKLYGSGLKAQASA